MYKTISPLVLASASPRRRELLARLGLEFEAVTSQVDETAEGPSDPATRAAHWARLKAEDVARRLTDPRWLLGVDTIVVIDGLILGKPGSRDEARAFLSRLAGRWHEVISAYCLLHSGDGRRRERSARTRVKIKALDPEEIEAYISTAEPYDKAGAYAAQGIGAFMIEEIAGGYTNVVGLPLTQLVGDLRELGVIEAVVGDGSGGR